MFHIRQEKSDPGVIGRHILDSPLDRLTSLERGHGEVLNMSRAGFSYLHRRDPLRELHYSETNRMPWQYPAMRYNGLTVSPSRKLRIVERKRESPLRLPASLIYHEKAVRIVAIIKQFSTLTTDQIAVLLGTDVNEVLIHLNNLHHASIIQRSPEDWSGRENVGDLWHVDERSHNFLGYVNGLEPWESGLIQGHSLENDPSPGANSPSSTRHTVLTNETLIRALEYGDDVVAIWGEPFLAASNFYSPADGEKTRKSHGDGAIVTRDGKVIILETIGGKIEGNYFDIASHKAASWAAVCGSSHIDVSVIFLNFNWNQSHKRILASVNKGLRDLSRDYMADEHERIRGINKVFVMDASRWFPDVNAISEDFSRLLAWSPLHYRLLDPTIPDPYVSDHDTRFRVVTNSIMTMHSPEWFNNNRIGYNVMLRPTGSMEDIMEKRKQAMLREFGDESHPTSMFSRLDGTFNELKRGDFLELL